MRCCQWNLFQCKEYSLITSLQNIHYLWCQDSSTSHNIPMSSRHDQECRSTCFISPKLMWLDFNHLQCHTIKNREKSIEWGVSLFTMKKRIFFFLMLWQTTWQTVKVRHWIPTTTSDKKMQPMIYEAINS